MKEIKSRNKHEKILKIKKDFKKRQKKQERGRWRYKRKKGLSE